MVVTFKRVIQDDVYLSTWCNGKQPEMHLRGEASLNRTVLGVRTRRVASNNIYSRWIDSGDHIG